MPDMRSLKIEFLWETFAYQFDLNNSIVINERTNVKKNIYRRDVNRNKVLHLRRHKKCNEREN